MPDEQATLYDVETRMPVDIRDLKDVDDGLLNGRYSYPAKARVYIQKDGNAGSVEAEELNEYIEQGWRVETPPQREFRDWKREEGSGISGAAKAFGAGAVNELFLGLPDVIARNELDPQDLAKYQFLKKNNAISHITGEVLGFAGSMLTPMGIPYRVGAKLAGAGAKAVVGRALKGRYQKAVADKASAISKAMGQGMTEEAAREAAKGVAGRAFERALKGSAEGILDLAPRAIAEGVYGNTDAMAEHLLWGGIAGGVLGPVLGSRGPESKELIMLNKRVQDNLERNKRYVDADFVGPSLPPMAAAPASKTAHALQGISGAKADDWQHYIDNIDDTRDLMKGTDVAAKKEDLLAPLQNVYDQAVIANDVVQGAKKFGEGDLGVIRNKYDDAIADQYKIMSEESTAAFNALKEGGVDNIATAPIIRELQKEQQRHMIGGVVPGDDEVISALKGLDSHIDFLAKKGETITSTEAKQFMQSLGRDIIWKPVGNKVPNRSLNNSLISVRRNLRVGFGQLQRKEPGIISEYERIMARLAERADKTEKFANNFVGKNGVNESSLLQVSAPKQGKDLMKDIFQNFTSLPGRTLLKEVEPGVFREIVEETGLHPIGKKITDQYRMAQVAEHMRKNIMPALKPLAKAKSSLDSVGLFNQERTPFLNAIRDIEGGRLAEMIDAKGILEIQNLKNSLRQMTPEMGAAAGGRPVFWERDIRNLNAFRRITAPQVTGARKVLTGIAGGYGLTALGVPAPLAIMLGGGTGFMGDQWLGKAIKGVVNATEDHAEGLLRAEAKTARFAKDIKELSERIKKSKRAYRPVKRRVFRKAIYRRLGVDYEKEPDRGKALSAVRDKLNELAENPELFIDYIEELTFGYRSGGAPEIAEMAAAKIVEVAGYLLDNLPKEPTAKPFGREIAWQPSAYDMKAWEDKAMVALDPSSITDLADEGSLNRNHMDALKTLYPNIAADITKAVFEDIGGHSITYQQRMKVGLLTGTVMDPSMNKVAYYQETYIPPEEREQEEAPVDMPQGAIDAATAAAGPASAQMEAGLNPDAGPDMSDLELPPEAGAMPPGPEMAAQVPQELPPEPLPPADMPMQPMGPELAAPGVQPPAGEFPGPGYEGLPPGGEFLQPPPAPEVPAPPIEYTEDGEPIIPLPPAPPNLTLGQEVIAFLEMFAGMETLGVGDTITVAGGTILPEQRKAFDEAMAIYPKMPGGKLIKVNFGKGKKVADELDESLSKLVDEIRGKETRTGAEDDLLRRYDKADFDDKPRQRRNQKMMDENFGGFPSERGKTDVDWHKGMDPDDVLKEGLIDDVKDLRDRGFGEDEIIERLKADYEPFDIVDEINRVRKSTEGIEGAARFKELADQMVENVPEKFIKGVSRRKDHHYRNAVLRVNKKDGPPVSSEPWLMEKGKFVPNFRAHEVGSNNLGGRHVKDYSGPDPLGYYDNRHAVTKSLMKNSPRPLKIHTRSDLIAHDDYIEAIPKGSEVNIYFGVPNNRVQSILRAGTASNGRLEKAVKILREAGIKVNVHHDKYPGLAAATQKIFNDGKPIPLGQANDIELTPELRARILKIMDLE